jgi:hypothetical protein
MPSVSSSKHNQVSAYQLNTITLQVIHTILTLAEYSLQNNSATTSNLPLAATSKEEQNSQGNLLRKKNLNLKIMLCIQIHQFFIYI